MFEVLKVEFSDFKKSIDKGTLVFGKYLDESDYEDDYSHNEIEEYQEKFIDKVKEYLHNKEPNKYIVTGGYCVFVMTVEEAKKRNVFNVEDYIVI